MKTAIVIPARYGSTRFPGKPLAMIGGKTMLARVVDVAHAAAAAHKNTSVIVTTEDSRIAHHAHEIGAQCIITPAECATGSDRVLAALNQIEKKFDCVINLQGDAPFTPPAAITALITAFEKNPQAEVVTAVHRLSWAALDALREAKKMTPFSGTTAIVDQTGRAVWFSKNIIPALRGEDDLRRATSVSPVLQHMGLYGYTPGALARFCALPQSRYEVLEGLEQLRFLENGITIHTVEIDPPAGGIHGGIDSPGDLARAQALFAS